MKTKKTIIILSFVVILIIILGAILGIKILKDKKTVEESNVETSNVEKTEENTEKIQEPKIIKKVDIVDVNSKDRPFAISINNTPVAVKVQEGLDKAFLIYEIPTEGGTSRLLAVFKDVEDATVGTIRSARHNFIDYALESDAIFVAYGWSHYAEDDLKAGAINYIQGLFGGPFWRSNPEKLASEHTAYTSIAKLRENSTQKGYRTTSTSAEKTIVLNYNAEDVDLSENVDAKEANTVIIPYGVGVKTQFDYDAETKEYTRIVNGNANIDHETKQKYTAKNIIVQKVTYSMCSDNYYWNLKTQGSGEGYFITNGYAVPITWSKSSRSAKTKYKYKDGTDVEVSDGRTYIELQTTMQTLTIE